MNAIFRIRIMIFYGLWHICDWYSVDVLSIVIDSSIGRYVCAVGIFDEANSGKGISLDVFGA